jgi:transcriptional regulator with XRE-family HTH domain
VSNSNLEQWLSLPDGPAARLRALRAQTGRSGKEFAEMLGWQPSKVSRLENGRQTPTSADLHAWVLACGVDAAVVDELRQLLERAHTAHRDWRRRMRLGQTPVQSDYNALTDQSSTIRYFETVYVPGYLQTAAYARRVLTEMVDLHGLAVDDVDAAVATRMQRQHALYDPGKQFEFLLAEPVLHWRLCPADVMRGQLDRLQAILGLPNIRFGILPMRPAAPLRTTPQNAFQLYDHTAVVESFVGEIVYRDERATAYARAMDRMWEEAVTGEEARQLIVETARDTLRR